MQDNDAAQNRADDSTCQERSKNGDLSFIRKVIEALVKGGFKLKYLDESNIARKRTGLRKMAVVGINRISEYIIW